MWPTVRNELECFRNLIRFLISSWRLPWSTVVHATVSSLIGFGATCASRPLSVIEEHGRLSERSRFNKLPSISAHEHALVKAGVYELVEGTCVEGEQRYRDTPFAEIPAHCLRRRLWTECLRGSWKDVEDISVLELRTVVRTVFDLLKYTSAQAQIAFSG